ncbi:MAG: hypothetical protein IJ593_08300 [Lachnospiraceae bacterium]|nr:hypothetical protein [Lachnospiraceae bacterium]
MNVKKRIVKKLFIALMTITVLGGCNSAIKNDSAKQSEVAQKAVSGNNKIKNGLIKVGENTYYYVNNEKQTEWQEIDGEWYYFDYDWGMLINTGIEWEGARYQLGEDGKMLKNCFWPLYPDSPLFYFDETGKALHDTQREINGTLYVFDSDGYVIKPSDYKDVTETIQETTKSNNNKKSLQELKNKLQATNFDDSQIKYCLEMIIDYTERIRNAGSRIEKEQLYSEEQIYYDQLKTLVNLYRDAQKYTGQTTNDVYLVDMFLEELF